MKDEMTKLPGTTPDLTELNTEKVKELFPQAVTEGKIDFDTLKSLLGDEVDDTHEKYQFTWHGKSKAIKLAQSPSRTTLRPSKDDSKNWDTTENLYIEGDNLEVLKQLQKTYFGKIKMIYIDPPYNTGGDFVYKDDFKDTIKNYKEQTNQSHKANAETSGRYHTDWLNMMYPRLMLAKNLLSVDGVICVSIDDNELFNLQKIMDEIFGNTNMVNLITIKMSEMKGAKLSHVSKKFPKIKEHLIIYSKNKEKIEISPLKLEKPMNELMKYVKYYNKRIVNLEDDINNWTIQDYKVSLKERIDNSKGLIYFVKPDNLPELDIEDNSFIRYINRDGKKIYFYNDNGTIKKVLFFDENRYSYIGDLWLKISTININKETYNIPTYTNGQKPIDLLNMLIKAFIRKNDYVLDFFSGSSTTADALIRLNKEGLSARFIMVQMAESIKITRGMDSNTKIATQKLINFLDDLGKPKLLTEIGKERIRRAGKHIQEEMTKDGKDSSSLDVGFKVFKLDSTNIKEWDSSQTLKEPTLLEYADIFKDGRTQEDVLYEILLKYGVFNMPVKEIQLNDKTAYDVAEGNTLICLADDINEEDIQAIGKLKPQNVIFKESGFKDDNVKLNAIYTLEKQGVEDIQAI